MPTMPASTISKKFGAAVRLKRLESGLSQEKLAELAGLHATYVGMVERGIRNPTLDVAAKLATALGTDLPSMLSTGPNPVIKRKRVE